MFNGQEYAKLFMIIVLLAGLAAKSDEVTIYNYNTGSYSTLDVSIAVDSVEVYDYDTGSFADLEVISVPGGVEVYDYTSGQYLELEIGE